MSQLVPILMAAAVVSVISAAVLFLYRDRRPFGRLLIPIAGTWVIFLALAWITVLLPPSSWGIIFLIAGAVGGIAMLVYTRRASTPRANLADRPEFWAIAVIGSMIALGLVLISSR
jgi:hypothetical protein